MTMRKIEGRDYVEIIAVDVVCARVRTGIPVRPPYVTGGAAAYFSIHRG